MNQRLTASQAEKAKKIHNDRTYDSCNMHSRTSFPPASI